MMKMVIKFLLFISLVCAVRGFPEGKKESNIKRIKATPAIPSTRLKDLENQVGEWKKKYEQILQMLATLE